LPLGELSAIGSAFLWALNGVLLKPITSRMSAIRITSPLYCFAALYILLFALSQGKIQEATQIPILQLGTLIIAGFIGMGAGDTSYVRSMTYLGVAKAFPISTGGYILLVFLLAAIVLGEAVTLAGLLGAGVLTAGIWLIVRSTAAELDGDQALVADGTNLRDGLIAAGIAGLCWAVTTTILKLALVGVDVLAANVFRVPMVALLLTSLNLTRHGFEFSAYDRRSMGIIAIAGLAGVAMSSMLFLYAIQEAGAAKTAVLSSTSPLFATGLSLVFLKERITLSVAAGTVLSVVGVWLVV